jgi:hypothetical protein
VFQCPFLLVVVDVEVAGIEALILDDDEQVVPLGLVEEHESRLAAACSELL